MRSAGKLLLERYRNDIEQANYPCNALDDEFVNFATDTVRFKPCKDDLDAN
jgi:hypothetical protein